MHSEIERALKQMTVTIQMQTDLTSSSSRSTEVIAETIEVDYKPFKLILPFKVKVLHACINENFITHLVYYSCYNFFV